MTDVTPLGLQGVFEIRPRKFGDARGFFSETYSGRALAEHGLRQVFVQDNQSYSASRGVLRGLHYQLPPFAQAKLVRVLRGAIFDVAVDIRKGSPTFGRWVGLEVSAEKWNQILVPAGFAHGFVTLTDDTEVAYKVDAYYSGEHDRSISYADPEIGIDWPVLTEDLTLSDKDRRAPLLRDAEVFTYEAVA